MAFAKLSKHSLTKGEGQSYKSLEDVIQKLDHADEIRWGTYQKATGVRHIGIYMEIDRFEPEERFLCTIDFDGDISVVHIGQPINWKQQTHTHVDTIAGTTEGRAYIKNVLEEFQRTIETYDYAMYNCRHATIDFIALAQNLKPNGKKLNLLVLKNLRGWFKRTWAEDGFLTKDYGLYFDKKIFGEKERRNVPAPHAMGLWIASKLFY